MYERTHPVKIFSNLWRVFYLVIIPVLRGFMLALQRDLLAWLSGAWVDVLVFLFMIAIAVLQWNSYHYFCDSAVIKVRSGIFVRRETIVLWDKVTTVSVVEPFYLRPFRAAVLRVDTPGGSWRGADLSIFIHRIKAEKILASRNGVASGLVKRRYLPRTMSVVLLSVLNSNSLAGIIFVATFVSQSGKLLGNEFSNMLIYTFEDLARTLTFGVPPAAAAIAYALLGGWVAGFLVTFVNYRNFQVSRVGSALAISGGVATLRKHGISYDKINFIDIRQSVAAIFFKLYSLYIHAVGYGKHKDDISCVILAEKVKPFTLNRHMLFSEFAFSEPEVKSPDGSLLKFIFQPLVPIIAVPAMIIALILLFPSLDSFILFTGFMLMVPCILFLIVRIIIYKTGGIAKIDNCYTLRYSSWFSIHTVIIPEEKISLVCFSRNFFQKRGKNPACDVIVYTPGEKKRRHMCRNISLNPARNIFSKNENPIS